MTTPAHKIAAILYRCAIETPRNDGEARSNADLEQDGNKAYSQWLLESSAAGDHATQDALSAVSRYDFADAWEALVASPQDHMTTPAGDWYAAIGDDGTRPVVWGLGETAEGALDDARAQDADPLAIDRVVRISPERAAEIDAGNVDASDL